MNTRSILILTAILPLAVLVTIGLVSQSTSIKKSIKLPPATQSKPPTVNVENRTYCLPLGRMLSPQRSDGRSPNYRPLRKGVGATNKSKRRKLPSKPR
jgi:hypothetical protein